MIWLVLIVGALGVLFVASQSAESPVQNSDSAPQIPLPSSNVSVASNSMGLPDCTALTQGGKWSTQYDDIFARVSVEQSVPFALLKAHAIRESALDGAAFRQEPSGKASYGLLQVLWWPSSQRFQKWGFDDDNMQSGALLYDPWTNCTISAHIMLDNWGTYGNIRDMINAYNTGKSESEHVAPNHYVDDVLKYYSTLTGSTVT